MTSVLACLVCAQPLDSLLTGGLHAGVAVMALVAVLVVAAIGRAALRLLREDRAALAARCGSPGEHRERRGAPIRKARRPRISRNIRGRSNAAGGDASSVECRRYFHHGLLKNEPRGHSR